MAVGGRRSASPSPSFTATERSMRDRDGDGDEDGMERTDVFADEFEEDFDFVADGFRPGEDHDRDGNEDEHHNLMTFEADDDNDLYAPSGSSLTPGATATITTSSPLISRNSTRKHRHGTSEENPFNYPSDAPLERSGSGNFAPGIAAYRVSSAASSIHPPTPTPRFGAAVPSHPYALYTQDTMPRSSSIRISRQSSLPSGPTHPYSMYPQGVDDEEDLDEEDGDVAPQNPVPLGFLGLGQSYRRRLGPDGEEQDIIGEYGHAEQLPPYTRYPEDGPEKMPLLAEPTALHSRAPVMGSDPGMALMHTHLQPQLPPQSMSDQAALLGRESTRDSMASGSMVESQSESNVTKKSWSEKSWRERRKTRFCYIPLWVYILAFGTLSFIGAVLGGVIGGFVEGQENPNRNNNSNVYTVITSLYDASFIATPATVTVPPTGSFKIALGAPQATQSACLPIPDQGPAWSCNLAGANGLAIEVASTDSNISGASLVYDGAQPNSQLFYGAQASELWTHYSPFAVVKDNDDPQWGIAYYFEQRFNKWVVVPSEALDVAAQTFKRDFQLPSAWSDQAQVASPADRPWFCYWNSTLLEVFVYINKPVNITAPTSSSSASGPLTTTGPSSPTSPGATPATNTSPSTGYNSGTTSATGTGTDTDSVTGTGLTATPTTAAAYTTTAPTSPHTSASIVTSAVTYTTATYSYTGPAAAYTSWLSSLVAEYGSPETAPIDAARMLRKREYREEYLIEDVVTNGPTYYPFLIKIEERRLPGSPTPYCIQYLVLDNGSWNVAPNPNGSSIPYTIELKEVDPPYSAYQEQGLADRLKSRTSDLVPGACHCQWLSGQGDGV